EMLDLPPIAEGPLFQVDILKSPLSHLLHRPFGGELVIAAIGDARTIHLRHPKEVVHHLRVLERLRLDLGQRLQIDFVASCFLREGSRDEEEGRDDRGSLPETPWARLARPGVGDAGKIAFCLSYGAYWTRNPFGNVASSSP